MSNETGVLAQLIMDRSYPIGNSKGDDERGRLHTKISNKADEPIPVIFQEGVPLFISADDTTNPGIEKTILSYTVPALNTVLISNIIVTCRIESVFKLKVNGDVVGTVRTGAARPNDRFPFDPSFPALQNQNIEITVKARDNSPISDCEAYLQASQTTTT